MGIFSKKKKNEIVIKTRRKSWTLRFLLGSTVLSTALQFFPNAVSKPYDQFMEEKSQTVNLSEHFHAANIRVYGRWNPLVPFHAAGQVAVNTWQESMRDPNPYYTLAAAHSALAYLTMLFHGLIPSFSLIDAWTIRPDLPLEERTVFIHPPADTTAGIYITSLVPADIGDTLKFKNNPEELKKVLFEYIMLHEARHGDQSDLIAVSTNESDADLYAFRVLQARGTDSAVLEEATTLIRHARILKSVMTLDNSHVTGFALTRDGQTPLEGCIDAADAARLYRVLDQAYNLNQDRFPDDMSKEEALIYLAIAANKAGVFEGDPSLQKTYAAFMESATYINGVSGGQLMNKTFDTSKLDLGFLKKDFKPVPDKLNVTAPRPVAQKSIKAPGFAA